jgi:hypothetical protein
MGFLDRLFSKRDTAPAGRVVDVVGGTPAPEDHDGLHITMTKSAGQPGLVKLSGTTTVAKDAMAALAERHGIGELGWLEIGGTLVPEPENPVDPDAVAVHIEGERVGYLPGYAAQDVTLPEGSARPVEVQIFTQLLPKGLRAEAWAWLGEGAPEWEWSEQNRPPMTSAAKSRVEHEQRREMVQNAADGSQVRAAQFEAGTVSGVHYLELIEPIKQLKRDGKLEEALTLCYAAIEGAEGSARAEDTSPAPWYTEQAAIIFRKLGDRDGEVAVLQRWLDACPPKYRAQSRLGERLAKLTGTPVSG